MPSGDEGTGLHAFDNLDPVSTVSALNVMPEPEPVALRRSVPPPPPPGRRPSALSITLPTPDARGTGSGVRSAGPQSSMPLPPPARGGAAVRSVPPPPPRSGSAPPVALVPDASVEGESESDEDTKVVPNSFVYDSDFAETPTSAMAAPGSEDAFEEFGASAESSGEPVGALGPDIALRGTARGVDDGELLELSPTTVATNIDMDWDEDEVQTQLRDEGHGESDAFAPQHVAGYGAGRPSPFPPPMASQYPGNPSPFAGREMTHTGDWEDDARTRVLSTGTGSLPAPPGLPRGFGFQAADSLTPGSNAATLAGDDLDRESSTGRTFAWAGIAAAALIGAIFGAFTLLAGDEPATMTLVTTPPDAEVLVNGTPLAGTSPFMAQKLDPELEHEITVRKQGFAAQTHRFRAQPGEVMPLPTIDLKPLREETGFALASAPEGAQIFVDGQKLEQVTPARITDLAPGMHVIRLEHGNGFQPWETHVALASGHVMELPAAKLVGAAGAARTRDFRDERVSNASSTRRRSPGSERVRSREPRVRAPERPKFATNITRVAAPPAAIKGNQGTLRVNSRPWAQVFVNGRLIGNTPQLNIPLPAGSHRVKLVNPQLKMTKNLKVDIRSGKVTTKIVEMMD